MKKARFEELKEEARNAGLNDTYLDDTCFESAQAWYEQEVDEKLSQREVDLLKYEYVKGFASGFAPAE